MVKQIILKEKVVMWDERLVCFVWFIKSVEENEYIMSRPSQNQLEALADFLLRNPGIAKGLLRSAQGKFESRRKWEEVATSPNAIGGVQKDGKGWAKYWADKKCYLKKICAQNVQSMRRTGAGAADSSVTLTPIDQKLVAVLGGPQFAVGDSNVAVNPFPSSSQTPSDVVQFLTLPTENRESFAVQNAEAVQVATITPSPPPPPISRDRSPIQPRRRSDRPSRSRSTLDEDRQMFASIERQRVEGEMITARAMADISQKLEMIANALNNIANALVTRR